MPSLRASRFTLTSPGDATLPGGRLGLVQITCAGLLWGTGGVVVRVLHDSHQLSPVTVAFYRLAVAAPILLGACARRRREIGAALRTAPLLLAATGVGLAVYQALYFVAVTAVGVNVATVVCIGLAPVLLAAANAARGRRRPPAGELLILVSALTGLCLVTLSGSGASATSPRPVVGLLCATVSGVLYALATTLGQRAARTVSPLPLTAVTTSVAALALAPVAAVTGLAVPVNGPVVLGLGYLGPVTSALAFGLFYLGLRNTSTATAAVLTLLEVPAAAVLAGVVLGDPLPALAVCGGLLMISAVAALYRRAAPIPTATGT